MKQAVLTGALLAVLSSVAAVQTSQTAGPAPAPATQDLTWITINGTGVNQVQIRQTDGTALTTLGGPPFNFQQPHDIVHVPSRRHVYVSNANGNAVTVIDADTFQFVANVTTPGASLLRGMSVSADESAVYVAGRDSVGVNPTPFTGPAVWKIDTLTLTMMKIVGVGDGPGVRAEDCVVIRAGNAGGTGDAPGKVYASVRNSVASRYFLIKNEMLGTSTSVDVGAGFPTPLDQVDFPDNMERTPDHRFVFAGCTKRGALGFTPLNAIRMLRFDPLTDALTAPVVSTVLPIQDLNHRVFDVTWKNEGGVNRGFIFVDIDAGVLRILEIDENGAHNAAVAPVNVGPPISAPATLRFTPPSRQLYLGETPGTSQSYNSYNAALPSPPPVAFERNQPVGATDPLNFAVVPAAVPVLKEITPKGGPEGGAFFVRINGSGFTPGSTVQAGGAGVFSSFVDSNTIMVDVGGGGAANLDFVVTNPSGLSGTLNPFYRRYVIPAVQPGETRNLPAAASGYQMVAFSQYASMSALQTALTAAFGPYNPSIYRVFFYRSGGYKEITQLSVEDADLAGQSFWVITRNGGTLQLAEADVHQNATGFDIAMVLEPGWNMISQPVLSGGGSIAWANLRATTNSAGFAAAVPASGFAGLSAVYEFVNGSYVTADPLIAGRGYWVNNSLSTHVYLIVNAAAVSKPGPNLGGAPAPAAMTPPPPPGGALVDGSGSSSGACGFVGVEWLLLGLVRFAFHRPPARRKLAA